MSEDLKELVVLLAQRVLVAAREDEELRRCLHQVASAVMAATGDAVAPAAEHLVPLPTVNEDVTGGASDQEETQPPGPSTDSSVPPASPPLQPPSTPSFGSSLAEEFVQIPQPIDVDDTELPLIEARCKLKAHGARWASTRRQRIAAGADFEVEIEPLDREIIARAKAIEDCFLWMCHPSGPSPSDLTLYENVAGCFDAVAAAVSLVRSLLGEAGDQSGRFEQALDLLAEAQSALRVGVAKLGGPTDADQKKAFYWLRAATGKHQVFVQRFMRMDDPAEPSRWPDISARIHALDTAVQAEQQRHKRFEQSLARVRYHLQLLGRGSGDVKHHWATVIRAVDELVMIEGTPPSNPTLRQLLFPLIDEVPDVEIPVGFQRVLREIDAYLATRPAEQPTERTPGSSPDVVKVADMLRGKVLVLIGGVPRTYALNALREAFALAAVDWIETKEHESIGHFEPNVARPEVAVVLLAIRWSSHVFGEVKQFCDRHGKPLVRLPGGYNPNQVAAQIIAQVSEKLQARNE